MGEIFEENYHRFGSSYPVLTEEVKEITQVVNSGLVEGMTKMILNGDKFIRFILKLGNLSSIKLLFKQRDIPAQDILTEEQIKIIYLYYSKSTETALTFNFAYGTYRDRSWGSLQLLYGDLEFSDEPKNLYSLKSFNLVESLEGECYLDIRTKVQ
jgi:hypothetical protein